jgi:multidrug efflux pump
MSLASTSIQRPVLTWVLSALIVLFGVLGLTQLGVREYPAIDPPNISISVSYRGASAELIEQQITEPLETALNGIDGVRTITSQSKEGSASITVEFDLGKDLEQAANDVRDRVSRAQRSLPADADPPTVAKADANSSPIMMLTLESDRRGLMELSDQGKWIMERLQTVAGVADVRIWGERRKAIWIRIHPRALASFGLSLAEVKSALNAENVDLPAGQLQGLYASVSMRADAGFSNVEELRRMILRQSSGRSVRLSDVADVTLSAENPNSILRVNGKPMLALAIIPQPGANQIDIADEVNKRVAELKRDLPKDLTLSSAIDNTRFVRAALTEVKETILIAFLLVVLVIFLFLRDWRTTLIPVLTIPISLVGVFSLMWAFGFSINVLTLLAVVLAIGIVVDDAIVVLENIYTKIEEGLEVRAAALKGIQEIFFAIVSTTLVLSAVFMPLLFLQGFTGRLFREFGFVIGGSVLISGFVALTLGGMLSSRLLKKHEQQNWFYRRTEPWFVGLDRFYETHLEKALNRPWLALPILLLAGLVTVGCFQSLKRELAPLEDRSSLTVNITGPEGATFLYMDARVQKISAIIQKTVPEAIVVLANTGQGGANSGSVRILLSPPKERKRSQKEIAQKMQGALSKVDGVKVSVLEEQTIRVGGRASQPVQVVLKATSLDTLRKVIPLIMAEAGEGSLLTAVDVNLRFTKPQLDVNFERERMRDLGLSATDVGLALQMGFSSQRYGYWMNEGQQYQIIGELDSISRLSAQGLSNVYVRNRTGDLISLSQVVSVAERQVPPQLYRYNRSAAATISAGLGEGVALGDAVNGMKEIIARVGGENIRTELTGTARDFVESSGSLGQVFVLALLLVYLLLAAQFESFRDPFVIMLTVPLALAGALASLWVGGHTLNLFSQIGLVMLVGLVTKNGILIVEFARQRRAAGLPLRHAVAEAAAARLRPILMTTFSTVLGILPIALALGAGSESRSPMGIAVVGGLLSALVLTLFVVPAMVVLVAKREK